MKAQGKQVTLDRALKMMPSGNYLPTDAVHRSSRILIDAVDLDDEDIPWLVEKFVALQLHYPYLKPVFLITALSPQELSRAGFIYETALTPSAWEGLGVGASYREYAERRVHEMMAVYKTTGYWAVQPGREIPRWLYER